MTNAIERTNVGSATGPTATTITPTMVLALALTLSIGPLSIGSLGASRAGAQDEVDPEGGDVWVPDTGPNNGAGTDGGTTGTTTGGTTTGTTAGATTAGTTSSTEGSATTGGGQATYAGSTGDPSASSTVQIQDNTTGPSSNVEPQDNRSDHERVVGRLGVGYMGITSVPIADADPSPDDVGCAAGSDGCPRIVAPALGVRYWIDSLLGIDAGIGLGLITGSVSAGDESQPINNAFAMTIHAGVPLALAFDGHFKFLIIPEVNIGFSTGSIIAPMPENDRGVSGFLFQVGGRIGTEIHFGFMGIPQLSLQAGVGLYFDFSTINLGQDSDSATPDVDVGAQIVRLGTTFEGDPWEILVGSLNALYYF